jgi:FixJ family two-component response regulator
MYLIDEDPLSRRDLIRLLAEIEIETWPFQSPSQLMSMLPSLEPGPVLLGLDADRPGESFELMDEMQRQGFDWPVIAASSEADTRLAVEAMKRGAVDFLDLPVRAERLDEAVAAASDRLERSSSERSARREAEQRLGALTGREMEVARALVRGMGNKTVAHHLGLSVRTIEMHRSRLLRKLGVRSLAEAAVLVAQAQAAEPPRGIGALRREAGLDWKGAAPPA